MTEPEVGQCPLKNVGPKATLNELDYGHLLKMKNTEFDSRNSVENINPDHSELPNVNHIVKRIPSIDLSDITTANEGIEENGGQRHLCVSFSKSQLVFSMPLSGDETDKISQLDNIDMMSQPGYSQVGIQGLSSDDRMSQLINSREHKKGNTTIM